MSAIPDPASSFEAADSKDATGEEATSRNAIEGRDPKTGQFLKGAKGVGGRKKGSRAKLGEAFFAELYSDFLEHGPQVIAQVRFRRPEIYMQVISKLMPQKLEISTPTDGLSDERLSELLEFAERMAGLQAEQAKVIEGSAVDVTPALPAPQVTLESLAKPPSRSPGRDAAAEARKADLRDQAAAAQSGEPPRPSPLPYPVGRAVPLSDREAERRNVAKLVDEGDDIDPASLF